MLDKEKYLNIDTMNDFTIEVSDTFEKKWRTGFPYKTKEIIEFTSKDPRNLNDIQNTKEPMLYVQSLVKMAIRHLTPIDYSSIFKDETIAYDEVVEWNDKHGLCIYTSVLLYFLFLI